uniref:Uncharacterized protein n=1 Tax=Molossus molossus TaxID=27622 RepID=A0A7J8G063_MOLMO|nr:hypothetical protein HJG59_008146 [Molossus molossus]
MVFGICCQRERLCKFLYVVQIFILAGMIYYYFQESLRNAAPDHEVAGESSQFYLSRDINCHSKFPSVPEAFRCRWALTVGQEPSAHTSALPPSSLLLMQPSGQTLRPLWGLMDKCYPVTTQRRRGRSGKKQASEAVTPKAMGGLKDAAPEEEPGILSQDEGEVRSLGQEAASPTPAGKEVTEGKEVAGTPGCEGNEKVHTEMAVYPSGRPPDLAPAACSASPIAALGPPAPEDALARLVPGL